MIISFLSGGLGNQMFQFAAAQALAEKHGHQLKIDPSYYQMYRQNRVFELAQVFTHEFAPASDDDLRQVLGLKKMIHQSPFWRRLYRRLPGTRNWLVEPQYHFWAPLLQQSQSCLIEGDWQSPHYFEDFADTIKKCFTFKTADFTDKALLQQLENSNSVAIHLRRGDYVSNPHTLGYHGLCEADYYLAAIAEIRRRRPDAGFFVFSDDIAAAREVLKAETALHFIEPNPERKNHFDMMLMSRCKHNIIANSTFSWWAAWLNANPGKIIIAPRRWFAAGHLSDRDLIPASWTRL